MKLNKSDLRVRMTGEYFAAVLRIASSSFTPNIEKLPKL
jgi:hypothetical protein